jgi:Fe-S cluster assembly scaffold IscU
LISGKSVPSNILTSYSFNRFQIVGDDITILDHFRKDFVGPYILFYCSAEIRTQCFKKIQYFSLPYSTFSLYVCVLQLSLSLYQKQGLVGAPACGDVMKLQIRVDDNGNIVESKFKTFGCGSAIASSSVATEWVKGKSVDEVLSIKNSDIAAHLKLPPVKLHCSMLAEDAIKAAVQDWKDKQANETEISAEAVA